MSYYFADLHLGHKAIHTYRGFETAAAHDDFVEKRYRETILKSIRSPMVEKHDTVYFLGDCAFNREGWERIDTWPGHKVIVLGNHCTEFEHISFIAGLKTVKSVHGLLKSHEHWLSHAPIHAEHLRGKRNIHGHLHGTLVEDRRYMNVSLENTNMAPMHISAIRAEFDRRQDLEYVRATLGEKAFCRASKK